MKIVIRSEVNDERTRTWVVTPNGVAGCYGLTRWHAFGNALALAVGLADVERARRRFLSVT